MLHKETIPPFLGKTLDDLMKIRELSNFLLVGGTALSLLLGHRRSIDIDLFEPNYNTGAELVPILRKYYPGIRISDIGFGISMYIPIPDSDKKLKVDICSNETFIRPYLLSDGIRIAHIEDIAAMKLEAITTRFEKKDYWDIAEILERYSLKDITEFYMERYPYNDLADVMGRLTQYDKCNEQPDPDCLNGKTWENVKNKLSYAFDNYISQELDDNISQG